MWWKIIFNRHKAFLRQSSKEKRINVQEYCSGFPNRGIGRLALGKLKSGAKP
jgi:hypothetical protein